MYVYAIELSNKKLAVFWSWCFFVNGGGGYEGEKWVIEERERRAERCEFGRRMGKSTTRIVVAVVIMDRAVT